ncbi:C3a anaphylatoxin chemotactic receptor-like [Pimephales promelas]|nr:C3a anaphylatoxin chemotactic receptor-like [Pimephales promelas]
MEATSFGPENVTGVTTEDYTTIYPKDSSFKIFYLCAYIVTFIVVISLDRCLCTWMVVWAQNNRTLFRARIICLIVWVSSIGCTIFIVNVNPMIQIEFDFLVEFLAPFLIIASAHIAVGVRIKRLKTRNRLRSYRKKLKQSLLLVLETAFAEDHLDFRGRQMQEDEQNKTNSFELLETYSALYEVMKCLDEVWTLYRIRPKVQLGPEKNIHCSELRPLPSKVNPSVQHSLIPPSQGKGRNASQEWKLYVTRTVTFERQGGCSQWAFITQSHAV